ncbi:hypothetical protein BDQ17DRAFT_1386144 [Cyathus striatus]|nr:hypothetical protein BDQ17DRAFT_1386144 [Cyathus striatus]
MSSPLSIPPSHLDIQSHLYSSFLQGRTADVALRVLGSWTAVYNLHRVGFFRSLFTAGFSESSNASPTRAPEEIHIRFDDRNITRAGQLCISRLYGGGPPLHIPPSLVPSTSQPLTPPFHQSDFIDPPLPPNHHLATPRFLLSLLATSIYLSIPSVASQALHLILSTVGPFTVIPYLNFALGRPIPSSSAEEPTAATGLENVAQIVPEYISPSAAASSSDVSNSKLEGDVEKAISHSTYCDSTNSSDDEQEESHPSYHYGALSDKIGEACACWLARWATDMFLLEDGGAGDKETRPILSRKRAQTLPTTSSTIDINPLSTEPELLSKVPLIWRRGGLTPVWIAALVSADTLFIRDERERYEFARSVVELRRKDGILESEEEIWSDMFSKAIYYMNMTFEELMSIANDISPTTQRPYVQLAVMQDAHWKHSIFRNQITYRPTTSFYTTGVSQAIPSSPPPRDKELGVTVTTAGILSKKPSTGELGASDEIQSSQYFAVPGDSSLRIGDGGLHARANQNNLPPSMEDLGTINPRTNAMSKVSTSEANFFGLLSSPYTADSCIQSDPEGTFWDLDLLKEKSRLHSHTVWYAGSLFNIYIQVVKKKNQTQLGIYLHRQSTVDPIPAASAPSPTLNEDRSFGAEPSLRSRGPSLPSLVSSSPSVQQRSPATITLSRTPTAPPQPYRDPRPQISAYFTISCASATGSTQTRFTSAPDVFSVSQSWGWKSSSLRAEEYIEILPEGAVSMKPSRNSRARSFRATVVLGLV